MLTNRDKTLIETVLFYELRTIHERGDKETVHNDARLVFWRFCSDYNMNPEEVFQVIDKMFEGKKNDFYPFFLGFRRIIFKGHESGNKPGNPATNLATSGLNREEDDDAR